MADDKVNSIPSNEKNLSYTTNRNDVIGMIQVPPRKVLDVGCSDGSLGLALKSVYGAAQVHGIEFDREFVKIAKNRLATVVEVDLNDKNLPILPSDIDLFIFADILEHTIAPKQVLKKILSQCAAADVNVVVSVPNVQHITVLLNLLIGKWPERERGIFDQTHLRWFTLESIKELADHADLEILKINRRYRINDKPRSKINRAARIFKFLPFKNFFTYQYVVLLKRKT